MEDQAKKLVKDELELQIQARATWRLRADSAA